MERRGGDAAGREGTGSASEGIGFRRYRRFPARPQLSSVPGRLFTARPAPRLGDSRKRPAPPVGGGRVPGVFRPAPLRRPAPPGTFPNPEPRTPNPVTRQRLKDVASLARRKGRRAHGQFLVEGVRSVEAAVAAGAPLVEVLVSHEAEADGRVAALVARAEAPVHRLPARDLDRVGDARTSQGVAAVARSVVAGALDVGRGGAVLALDGVQDPGNVGALVRTAAWFGVGTVVADEKTADFETPKAVRASMGGLWDVRLVRVPALGPALDALAGAGRALWGADLGGTPLAAWAPGPDAVLVVGSEAHGLSAEAAERVRTHGGTVYVPGGAGRGVESLNVAVAAGVLLAALAGAGR